MKRKKIAIITGASSGLGNEFTKQISSMFQCIEEIWIIARRKDRLDELSNQINTNVKVIEGDLTKTDFLDQLKEMLRIEDPCIKFFVNSAGYGQIGPFKNSNYEKQLGMVDLNCKSLTALTYMILPYMGENSRILQIASAAAFMPQPRFAVYAATKSYVLSFSRALNAELNQSKIYVTAVCPGPVETEFFDVAETEQSMAWYKNLIMADCTKVVRKAIKDSLRKKEKSIYGRAMFLLFLLTKFIPHSMLIRLMKDVS